MAKKRGNPDDYQGISPVTNGKIILENSFNAYRQKRDAVKSTKYKTTLTKAKNMSKEAIKAFSKSARKQLENIVNQFPRAEDLKGAISELVEIQYDINDIKINLGNINWAQNNIKNIEVLHQRRLSRIRNEDDIEGIRKAFIGRASSILRQVEGSFKFLENYRKFLKELPVLKEGYVTVAIAGFPNAGKSTLLSRLTKARPEINIYPFTTKGLNLGTITKDTMRLQLIDTPGTLNRPEKMNDIEKKAYVIIRHSDIIVYIFDPVLNYSLKEQEKLLKSIREMNPDARIITYISKTDIVPDYSDKLNDKIVNSSVRSPLKLLEAVFSSLSSQANRRART